jgi:hypothetical protein|tara:strand:- start:241 stop:543 length:303 start_codon:yes stop_codon:yes gene_type:complete
MREKRMERETVEQYMKRGGTITVLPMQPNGIPYGTGFLSTVAQVSEEPTEDVKTVSWRELQEDVDPETEDKSYWVTLNSRMTKLLKKIEKVKPAKEYRKY